MRPEFFEKSGATLTLTVEEAALMSAEINQTETEIVNGMQEVQKAFDIQEVIEGGDPAANAFTNTDVLALSDAVNEITGAVMGGVVIVDYTPTVEGFVDQAKTIYQKVAEMLKRIWTYIKNFFKRLFDYRNHLRARLKVLRSKLHSLTDKPVTEKPTINVPMTDGKIFTVQGKKLLDTSSFQSVMQDIFKNVKLNFDRGPVAINAMGEAFRGCLQKFDPNNAEESTEKAMVNDVLPAMWRYFDAFGIKDFKKNLIGGHGANQFTAHSQALAGSCYVEFTWGSAMNEFFIDRKLPEGTSMSRVIQDLTSARAELKADKPIDHSNTLTMPAFKPGGMEAALKEVERGLNLLDDLESKQSRTNQDFSEAFQRLAEETAKKFKPEDGEKAGHTADTAHQIYNSLIRLPAAYVNLAHQPISDMAKRATGTFEAVLNMVERSMKMYNLKEHEQDFKPAGM